MITLLRQFAISSLLSYRALFTWLNPWGYVSSRILMPILLTILFALVSTYSHNTVSQPVVGGSMLAIALSAIFGMALAVGNERRFGTLSAWLASPESLFTNLAGKAAIHILDGILGAVLTLATTTIIFSVFLDLNQLLYLFWIALIVSGSSAGAGLVVAAATFRWRDTFTPPNVAMHMYMLLSGALVPLSLLPFSAEPIADFMPLTHAIKATNQVIIYSTFPTNQVILEAVIGLIWGFFGYLAIKLMVQSARKNGTLDIN